MKNKLFILFSELVPTFIINILGWCTIFLLIPVVAPNIDLNNACLVSTIIAILSGIYFARFKCKPFNQHFKYKNYNKFIKRQIMYHNYIQVSNCIMYLMFICMSYMMVYWTYTHKELHNSFVLFMLDFVSYLTLVANIILFLMIYYFKDFYFILYHRPTCKI